MEKNSIRWEILLKGARGRRNHFSKVVGPGYTT